jgi:hypothetical protein
MGLERPSDRKVRECFATTDQTILQQGRRKGTTEAYVVQYAAERHLTRTQLQGVFSGRLEVPGEAAHEKSRITGHEMNSVDACRFVAQTRFEIESGLLPLGVEEILNKQEGL